MQISSENYITVLTDQVNTLIIENAQLKAHILDLQTKEKEANDDENEESGSEPSK